MNTYRRYNGQWLVCCDRMHNAGDVITVTLRNGATKQETLGNHVPRAGGNCYETARTAPQAQAVGDLAPVLAMFQAARLHKKLPAIVLSVPEAGMSVRLSIAGDAARVPGSVTVLDAERGMDGRKWLGRILRTGTYEPSYAANGRTDAIVKRLRDFAADPARVAAEHGRLTRTCCFCNIALSDPRSVAVGYGATCAAHHGVPYPKSAPTPTPTTPSAPAPAAASRMPQPDLDLF